MEEWKSIICDSDQCLSEMFVPENMKAKDNSLNEQALEKYKIRPSMEEENSIQFTCPRCGKITTWGRMRIDIARKLYERYS